MYALSLFGIIIDIFVDIFVDTFVDIFVDVFKLYILFTINFSNLSQFIFFSHIFY
jgi:hypothetical protein